jgi:hypothetical protein
MALRNKEILMAKPIPARVAAFHANGADRYGVVTDAGIIDMTPEFGNRFANLQNIVEAGALEEVIAAAKDRTPTHREQDISYLIPIAPLRSQFLPWVTLNLAWRTQSRIVPSLQRVIAAI